MREADSHSRAVEVLAAMREVCGDDAVTEVRDAARWLQTAPRGPVICVAPASETETAEVLKCAYHHGWTVKPFGAGTQLTGEAIGAPVDIVLSLARMNRILDFNPGDLVVSVEPGVTLEQLHVALAERATMLPLDPWVSEEATIGGVVATGASGPRRALYGGVRDLTIGLRVVCADGTVIRTGSKVVKNVAGYDLTKLFVGSRGTLGVVTEATFKLRPLPLHRETVVLSGPLAGVSRVAEHLGASVLIPSRADVFNRFDIGAEAEGADALGTWLLAVDCDENERAAAYQSRELLSWAKDGGLTAVVLEGAAADEWWQARRDEVRDANLALRVSAPPARWSDVSDRVSAVGAAHGTVWMQRCSVSAGVAYLYAEEPSEQSARKLVSAVRDAVRELGGAVVIERASSETRAAVDPYGPTGVTAQLLCRVKDQLDPNRLFSPASFAGGI